jgi:hypothetical protein
MKVSTKPFDLGFQARTEGLMVTMNPYATGTKDACQWFLGWDIADSDMDV